MVTTGSIKQGNYDALHGQTMQIALLGAEIGSARDVKESLVQFIPFHFPHYLHGPHALL